MSTTVDNRVINLVMNSGDFVKNAENAANALKKLEAAMRIDSKASGLATMSESAQKLSSSLDKTAAALDRASGSANTLSNAKEPSWKLLLHIQVMLSP